MLLVAIRLLMWSSLLVVLILYPISAWLVLRFARPPYRTWLFCLVNVLGAYGACTATLVGFGHSPAELQALMRVVGIGFLGYLSFTLVEFVLLRRSRASNAWATSALWFPIVCLVLVKYVPFVQNAFRGPLHGIEVARLSVLFLGLSYMSFRLCHLVQEVRNGVVEMPAVEEYLCFAFFVPTLSVGPINPYSRFIRSYRSPDRNKTPLHRSLLRILVGLTKYFFLGTLLNQYTYAGLLLDGHPHHRFDLILSIFAFTLYLYCNFSGFCDMAIGISGLLGIEVMENFDAPLLSRNIQEFWNRWHISLSVWLRDMMFTPVVKVLVRRFGPKSANHVIAFTICLVFLIIGIWHGVGLNFALFGLSQGVGLAFVHYYTILLKKRLGREGLASYRANAFIHAAAVVLTFVYFSFSLFLFANSWDKIQEIHRVII